MKLGVLLNGTSAKSKLGWVIAMAGWFTLWFTFGGAIGEIDFEIVGCFVMGSEMFGTTAGGDNDARACELELDVSSLFLGDVGD